MRIRLQKGALTAEIDTLGAELKSLQLKRLEYIWQGNPAVWGESAPLLFPMVGRQINDTYCYNDKSYHIYQHGFARFKEFRVATQTAEQAVLALRDDEQTLTQFPFHFELTTVYTLSEDGLNVSRKVSNLNEYDMYYAIGEHPGFCIPGPDSGCRLQFSEPEEAARWILDDEIITKEEPFLHGREIDITNDLFNRGALIFKGLKSRTVTLERESGHSVIVELSNHPYLGIWAKKAADYVCIEPWNGLTCSKWSTAEWTEKEGINRLLPGESAVYNMTITLR